MLPALIAVSAVGWVLFAIGFVWLGITSPKRRMTPREAADFAQDRRPPRDGNAVLQRSWRWSWFRGRAWGVSWFDEISFTELKRGFRQSRWRASVRYQQFAILIVGFLAGLFGLVLLVGWEIGTVGFVVATGIVAYVSFQLTRAFVRA